MVLLALAVVSSVAGAEECIYDQENQAQVLREAAARRPGGQLDQRERRIAWALPSGATLTYTYGGCTHLGSEVSLSEPRRVARTEAQVFATARDLARQWWDKVDAAALRSGLQGKRFQREEEAGRVVYAVAHEFYAEFSVTHEFVGGMDRVTIVWVRDF